jgi:ATP-dependent DNA ligase
MAAKAVDQLPTGPGWSYEPKYDGFRALAFRDDHGVHLQSRQLRNLTPTFPDVATAVGQLDDVVLDGEIVVWRSGRFDFAGLQDRLRSGRARVRDLVTAAPAAFVVFDLLAHNGTDLRDRPYSKRRRRLEKLVARGLPDGLVLTPATTDAAVARSWMLGHTQTGLEGVVAKRLGQPYRPGVRAWHKLRTRVTAEAVVGGVIGPVDAPRELILGRFDQGGRLRIAGRSTTLRPAASAELGRLLRPATVHPWPETLPPHPYGGGRTTYNRVTPEIVVELSADLAVDGLRWRHPVRFVRVRGELTAADLAGGMRAFEGSSPTGLPGHRCTP